MEEMTQKQPDVDRVTKTYKRKTTDPKHASFNDKTRSSECALLILITSCTDDLIMFRK